MKEIHQLRLFEGGFAISRGEDGRFVEPPKRPGVFLSRACAEAYLEYMQSPKPVSESRELARMPPVDAKENKIRRKLAQKREAEIIKLREELQIQIAQKHGVKWNKELGFHD